MGNIWFTSDHHFGHSNVVRYNKRPFLTGRIDAKGKPEVDIDRHDAILIQNWNNHVMPRDTVYFLGDFAYRNKEAATKYRQRLNGNIFFIEGNHDSASHQIRNLFSWYGSVHEMKYRVENHTELLEGTIFLSHYAHRVWNKCHYNSFHLYGHSHNSLPENMNSLSFDIGVDAIAARLSGKPSGQNYEGLPEQDYRPFSLEEVIAVMKTKNFVPIDHHGRRGE